ncbi:MAG: M13 family metallopeptidase [Elusimicrobiaceae bacterium]|nr:M13 family metallopeptidase [Elusimicrobiaceae bacterium]
MKKLGIRISALLLLSATAAMAGGIDTAAMDRTADPCTDFYQYSCGSWLKNNPIPADRASWGRFDELNERNLSILKGILEKASADDPGRDATDQKIGDFYASCMDENGIESASVLPLKPELDAIAALKNGGEISGALARLHRLGVKVLFNFSSSPDYENAKMTIGEFDQGGLGLPEKDYYLKQDPKSVELRDRYVLHMTRMFGLIGYGTERSSVAARTVLAFETELARASQGMVERRDPKNIYHRTTPEQLAELAPGVDWAAFLTALGAPEMREFNLVSPDFFKRLGELTKSEPLDTWKIYLTWHYLSADADLLPAAFVDENFDFYGKALTGAKELRPRWKRCTMMTDRLLGEALGRRYVETAFGAGGKARVLEMVANIEKALEQDIEKLDWMTPETRKQALIKLKGITNKMGYPDQWRDYSPVAVARDDLAGNVTRADWFEYSRDIAKIGKPVDKSEWHMTPPTVNAYYSAQMNNINFPAGILQPPFFGQNKPDAVNLGGIGVVIGHELTHGFDDHGRQYDADGNLRDWWTRRDVEEFNKRTVCLENEYSQFVAIDDVKLNGKLTLGENTADAGGLRLAYMALESLLEAKPVSTVDGFTQQQSFFISFGQIWCRNATPEKLRMQALTDPHSVARYRVNGSVVNMPEFAKAFSCQAGSPMVSPNPCRVW